MLGVGQAGRGATVVQRIAEAHHGRRSPGLDQAGEHGQRLPRVVARQELVRRHGVGRPLL